MSRGNVFERSHLRGTKSGKVNKTITASGENHDKPKMHQGTSDFFSRTGTIDRRTKPARRGAGAGGTEPDVLDIIAALAEQDMIDFVAETGIHAPVAVLEPDFDQMTTEEFDRFLTEWQP